jgi:hypothetical protein
MRLVCPRPRHAGRSSAIQDGERRDNSILAARTRVLRGEFYVRACIVNPRTSEKDVDAAVPEVLASGVQV